MLNQMVRNILLYNHQHSDFPMTSEQMEQYVPKSLIYSLLWSFAGDAKMKVRHAMSDFVRSITTIPLPPITTVPILDFEVGMSFLWEKFQDKQITFLHLRFPCIKILMLTIVYYNNFATSIIRSAIIGG